MHRCESLVDTALDPLVHIDQTIMQLGWLAQRQFMQLLSNPRFDLTVPQFYTLLHLASSPAECRMTDLARATQQSATSLTGVVDRLIDKQLAARVRPSDDRRQVMVTLTERGRALLRDVQQARRDEMYLSLSDFPPADVKTLVGLLDRVVAGMQQSADEREPRSPD